MFLSIPQRRFILVILFLCYLSSLVIMNTQKIAWKRKLFDGILKEKNVWRNIKTQLCGIHNEERNIRWFHMEQNVFVVSRYVLFSPHRRRRCRRRRRSYIFQILSNDYACFTIKNSLCSDLYRVFIFFFYYQLFNVVFSRGSFTKRSILHRFVVVVVIIT